MVLPALFTEGAQQTVSLQHAKLIPMNGTSAPSCTSLAAKTAMVSPKMTWEAPSFSLADRLNETTVIVLPVTSGYTTDLQWLLWRVPA